MCWSRYRGADFSRTWESVFESQRSLGLAKHVNLSGIGTARLERVETHAHRTRVELVYSRKYCVPPSSPTVRVSGIESSRADYRLGFLNTDFQPSQSGTIVAFQRTERDCYTICGDEPVWSE